MKNLSARISSQFYRLIPSLFWSQYAVRAGSVGLDRLYLTLSFDCDTNEDISASEKIFAWLQARDLPATFAVPGAQLKKGSAVYRDIAASGAEFINHGAAAHSEWRDGRYWSITFYDKIDPEAVEIDIRRGHEITYDCIDQQPVGFRAPHFGHYQQPEQLTHLYRILGQLGYRYASTTIPKFLTSHGPVYKKEGIYEIPVSGIYTQPLKIFDSWTHIPDPHTPKVSEHYGLKLKNSAFKFVQHRINGVMNYYSDPAHVVESNTYYDALQYCYDIGVKFVTYSQLLDIIEAKS